MFDRLLSLYSRDLSYAIVGYRRGCLGDLVGHFHHGGLVSSGGASCSRTLFRRFVYLIHRWDLYAYFFWQTQHGLVGFDPEYYPEQSRARTMAVTTGTQAADGTMLEPSAMVYGDVGI